MREALEYLDKIPMWASKKNSLKDIRDFLGEMGNPDRDRRIIHVAGTNGKGSVCAYMTSILNRAGYRTATFISPHLISVKERFLINGQPAADQDFLKAFQEVKGLAETMTAKGYGPPSYFEFLFYMFMAVVTRQNPDFVILETGLGGLLDTTNVIEHPVLTIITSISMDHMQYLGDTIEKIAGQKAGILKQGVPVVYDGACRESTQVIEEAARKKGCPVYPVSGKDWRFLRRDDRGIRIVADGNAAAGNVAAAEEEQDPLEFLIPSQADYQQMNSMLAVRAVSVLNKIREAEISRDAVAEGIRTTFWPARMEEVLPGVYLDGAHNAGGMKALTAAISRMQQEHGEPAALMFGVVSDKEYHKMIQELCSRVKIRSVTITRMDTDRSMDTEELAREFKELLSCPVEAFETVEKAWEHFLKEKGEGLGFCAGSLYLAGQVKGLLAKDL